MTVSEINESEFQKHAKRKILASESRFIYM